MLYHLLYPLKDFWFGFNVFKYITFRSAMAAITAFLLSIFLGEGFIRMLRAHRIREHARRGDAPALDKFADEKSGTPTMGGIFIISALVLSTLLWARLTNGFVWMCLTTTVLLGLVGAVDDIIKLVKKDSKGLQAKTKFAGQLMIGAALALILYYSPGWSRALHFPFLKRLVLDLGILYVPFVVIVIVGTSNAVNLTDGLDGLAGGCILMVAATYSVMSYVVGHADISGYLAIQFIPEAAELTVFCAAMAGAILGFLWYNAYPATVFMGDTGSLALGGGIGIVAVIIKQEIMLFIVGAIFVAEVVSVVLQVASFKMRGKRIFRMTPLHHHFQLGGLPETKITVRFLIIAFILALVTLATLKLR